MQRRDAALLIADLLRRDTGVRVRVTGASMAPFLRDGDTVEVRSVAPETLRRGDLVFTLVRSDEPVLHRIVAVRRTGGGALRFVTKGDALAAPDEPVPADCVLGRVVRLARTSRSSAAPFRSLDGRFAHVTAAAIAAIGRRAPRLLRRVASLPHRIPGLRPR